MDKQKVIDTKCPMCNKVTSHIITQEQYGKLISYNRPSIQVIFPDMKKEEREQFITGYCPSCWSSIFKK